MPQSRSGNKMTATHGAQAEPVLIQTAANGVTTLRLNRPAKLNALSEDLLEALQSALDSVAANPDAQCVVIEGAGKAFCAGHDLAEMRRKPDEEYYKSLFAACSKMMQSIVNLPVPVIAKVHGLATAAGCQLVASCDLAIASNAAKFAVSGINVGLFCSTPAVALSRNVSAKNAFDMLVTGDFVDAETAVKLGLINQAVDDAELDAAVAAKALSIAGKDPQSIRLGKALFHRQRQMTLPDAYALAGTFMASNMMLADTGEAIDAFVAKRKPVLSFQASK
jgi:enoyl-CoA hydratase/carnithine racemase